LSRQDLLQLLRPAHKVPRTIWSSRHPLNFRPNFSTLLALVVGLWIFGTGEAVLIAAGIGVSPWYEDFLATGERWEKRGKRMDEQIDILKGLMNGEYFAYKGEFYDIPELKLCPAPTKPVPILIGGHSKLALKRAARIGDGWISAGLSLEETKTLIDQINEYRDEFGTLDHPNYQFQVMGEAAYSPDGIKKLDELGATEVIVAFRNTYEGGPDERTLEGMIAEINWYADEVIKKSI